MSSMICGHFEFRETVELVSPYGYIRGERTRLANGSIGHVAGERDGKVWVEFGFSDAAAVPIHWLRRVERP
jgi:hypothetical protein